MDLLLDKLNGISSEGLKSLERFKAEVNFARAFATAYPEKEAKWTELLYNSTDFVANKFNEDGISCLDTAISEAEDMLAPIGVIAKEHIIHCIGHAHIDMNWTWSEFETVAVTHDTFATTLKLMEEYPDFKYTQSQVTVYKAMKRYFPEICPKIKQKIEDGNWEVSAACWCEIDDNMTGGEAFARNILYSKRYMKEHFGVSYDKLRIDWKADTFGHAWTLPTIMKHGGIDRFYHMRPGAQHWLAWWEAPDGSKVLEFDDGKGSYVAPITPHMAHMMIDYYKEMKLKDFLWVFGVGDHGGGPTRRHLNSALELMTWKIFPTVKLSTNEAFFDAVEKSGDKIPTHKDEINFIFRGCYTSQSKVKRINRLAECLIPEAETATTLMGNLVEIEYPKEEIRTAWENTMYNQFHDILAGSSEHNAMEDSDYRFRETEAICGSLKMRVMNGIAKRVDTASKFSHINWDNNGIEAGFGDVRLLGRNTNFGGNSSQSDIFLVYNPTSKPRSEVVFTKVWNKAIPADKVAVQDDQGNIVPAQIVGNSIYVEHTGINIAFFAKDVPAYGYKTFAVYESEKPIIEKDPSYQPHLFGLRQERPAGLKIDGVVMLSPFSMENEFVRIDVDPGSGAIAHYIDKETGFDYVPKGKLLGILEYAIEIPHFMTSWQTAQETSSEKITKGGRLVAEGDPSTNFDGDILSMVASSRSPLQGPVRGSIRTIHNVGERSRVIIEIGLDVKSKAADINVEARWREIGDNNNGVQILKMAFPIEGDNKTATYEIPFATITRPLDGEDVPGLRWVDFASDKVGLTILNDSKNGFSATEEEMKVNLLRTSYDPDPLPEMGKHDMRFRIIPRRDKLNTETAMEAAEIFNKPMGLTSTGIHEGDLCTTNSFAELISGTAQISSIKKAEDGEETVLRLYEITGKDTIAKVKLPYLLTGNKKAYFCNLLEEIISNEPLKTNGNVLEVPIKPYGLVSVIIK